MTISPAPIILVALALGTCFPVRAEQSLETDGFVIHYNALSTDELSPEVARLYGIARGKDRGILNVTVLKDHMGLESLPVRAKVKASAQDDAAGSRQLVPREVMDGGAIYYIAEFPVHGDSSMTFQIHVTPEGGTPHEVAFKHDFHAE